MRHYLEEKLYSRQIFRVNPNEAETGDRNRSPKHKERQERKAAGLHSSLEFSALSGLKRTIEANDWKEGAEIPGDGPLGSPELPDHFNLGVFPVEILAAQVGARVVGQKRDALPH